MATQGRRCRLTRGRRLGLDELMIVNPASAGFGVCFLGDDGILYRVQRLPPKSSIRPGAPRLRDEQWVARRLFLGEDGTVYEVVR
jgi:hypothetical protein